MQNQQTISKRPTENTALEFNRVQVDERIPVKLKEINGPSGLEPTRYGDWERKGRCVDF